MEKWECGRPSADTPAGVDGAGDDASLMDLGPTPAGAGLESAAAETAASVDSQMDAWGDDSNSSDKALYFDDGVRTCITAFTRAEKQQTDRQTDRQTGSCASLLSTNIC